MTAARIAKTGKKENCPYCRDGWKRKLSISQRQAAKRKIFVQIRDGSKTMLADLIRKNVKL